MFSVVNPGTGSYGEALEIQDVEVEQLPKRDRENSQVSSNGSFNNIEITEMNALEMSYTRLQWKDNHKDEGTGRADVQEESKSE
jgi:hypothetical protein